MKSRTPWRRTDEAKKLRVWMVVIALVLTGAVIGCGYWIWSSLPHGSAQPGSTSSLSDGDNRKEVILPVYDDGFNLILVNATHELSADFTVNLVEIDGVQVEERIAKALKKMLEDARADGCELKLVSGYVSREQQEEAYQSKVTELMGQGMSRVTAEDQALPYVSRGGFSEYQTGMAVNLTKENLAAGADFTDTDEYRWLIKNSISYGFVLRNAENKESKTGMRFDPCHFRYVGTNNAQRMRQLGMSLEEYAVYVYRQANW